MAVTKSTLLPNGTVAEDPRELADGSGHSLDTYALARSIASEYASGNETEKVAIAYAIQNEANNRHLSVFRLLDYVEKVGHTDTFGAQWQGRFASTARDPEVEDLRIARAVRRGLVADPTGGARKFFDPSTQNRLYVERWRGVRYDAEGLLAHWRKEGWRPIYVAGVNESKLLLLTQARLPRVVHVATAGMMALGTALAAWWAGR